MNSAFRFRRLRQSEALRTLVRETAVTRNDLILPLFVEENITSPVPIESMPGVVRHTESGLPEAVRSAYAAGVRAVILFGVSHHKDAVGSDSWDDDGLVVRMIRAAKLAQPETLVISDNCFCEYTDHGHCGVVSGENVDNDQTVANLCKQSLAAARAGADMLAPSGMMDGMVASMRAALDAEGFQSLPIMSYSSKFASAYYGPFRDAVDSSFKGNRDGYQLDMANAREAVAESVRDEHEGADILMVKPGIAYLDILCRVRAQTERPLAVYQVSGEYAMIKAAAAAGFIDEQAMVMESMTAFKRAGADLIITYFAEQVCEWVA